MSNVDRVKDMCKIGLNLIPPVIVRARQETQWFYLYRPFCV